MRKSNLNGNLYQKWEYSNSLFKKYEFEKKKYTKREKMDFLKILEGFKEIKKRKKNYGQSLKN